MDTLNITVYDGKYTVIQSADGHLRALRYGQEWRDLTGDGLVLALAMEVQSLRERLEEMRGELSGPSWEDENRERYGV